MFSLNVFLLFLCAHIYFERNAFKNFEFYRKPNILVKIVKCVTVVFGIDIRICYQLFKDDY